MPLRYGAVWRQKVHQHIKSTGDDARRTFNHFAKSNTVCPCYNTIRAWHDECVQTGACTLPVRKGLRKNGTARLEPGHLDELRRIITEEPRLYFDEMRDALFVAVGRKYHATTICRALHAPPPRGLGFTRQVLQRRAREASEAEKALFLEAVRGFEAKDFVWIDESHCDPGSCRRKYGYLLRGGSQTYYVLENFGPIEKRYSLLAAADVQGFVVEACEAIEGNIDADRFVRWVSECLCPTLGNYALNEPRSVVVMDNASIHHKMLEIVEALVHERGAIIIFLSPYSPFLNPIEMCFKHLKAFFKRNWSFSTDILDDGLLSVTPGHMRAFCHHSGYEAQINQLVVAEEHELAAVLAFAAVAFLL